MCFMYILVHKKFQYLFIHINQEICSKIYVERPLENYYLSWSESLNRPSNLRDVLPLISQSFLSNLLTCINRCLLEVHLRIREDRQVYRVRSSHISSALLLISYYFLIISWLNIIYVISMVSLSNKPISHIFPLIISGNLVVSRIT